MASTKKNGELAYKLLDTREKLGLGKKREINKLFVFPDSSASINWKSTNRDARLGCYE